MILRGMPPTRPDSVALIRFRSLKAGRRKDKGEKRDNSTADTEAVCPVSEQRSSFLAGAIHIAIRSEDTNLTDKRPTGMRSQGMQRPSGLVTNARTRAEMETRLYVVQVLCGAG